MDWTLPLSPENMPPGCEVHERSIPNSRVVRFLGRVDAAEQPCTMESGCGRSDSVTVYRLPTRGLNLPAEQAQVNELRWCANDGMIGCVRKDTTEQEAEWGWNHRAVC